MSDPSPEEAKKRRQQKIERQLDEALAATFPASDPVSIVSPHEEEDFGTDSVAPATPAKNIPPSGN